MRLSQKIFNNSEIIYIYCLGIFLFSLPFQVKFNNVGLIILIVGWLINLKNLKSSLRTETHAYFYLALASFYLYFVIRGFSFNEAESLFHHNALKEYGRKSALILLPILFNIPAINRNYKFILYAFAGGVFFAISICIVNALHINLEEGIRANRGILYFNPWYFSNILLVKPVNFHPTIFALTCSIILHISVLQILKLGQPNIRIFKNTKIAITVAVILFIFMLMLSSRNVLLFSIISISILFIKYVLASTRFIYLLYFILAVTAIVSFDLSINHVNRQRVVDLLSMNKDPLDNSFGGTSFRVACSNALYQEIVKDNWLMGIGSGGNQQTFNQAYMKHGLTVAAEANYNAHNQYLETLIDNGILGLILILITYALAFRISYVNSAYLGLIAVYLLATVSLTESILERQKGIWIFTAALFIFCSYTIKSKKVN